MRRRQCYWKSANTFNSACFIKKCKNEKVIIYFPKFGQMSNTYCPKHWSFFCLFFSHLLILPAHSCTPLTSEVKTTVHLVTIRCFGGEIWVLVFMWMRITQITHPNIIEGQVDPLMAVALEWPHSPKTCKHFSPHCHSRCVKWFLIQKCFRLQLKSIWYFW